MPERIVTRTVPAVPTSDGAGVKLFRTIATPQLDHLDPFLLLDEFRSDRADDYLAGFPDHPHRGFETVTYMLAGAMEHRDHLGNHGRLEPGSVQWMTAGRGIIHSEMPRQADGLMWGFQLWVNLPAVSKMQPPRYQDIASAQVPEIEPREGVRLRVIAGEVFGTSGPVKGVATSPLYADVSVDQERRLTLPIPAGHSAFLYVFEGQLDVGSESLAVRTLAVLGDGDAVTLAGGDEGGRALLVAARPLAEPIARHGPFVMTTDEEIRQAFRDLRDGTFLS